MPKGNNKRNNKGNKKVNKKATNIKKKTNSSSGKSKSGKSSSGKSKSGKSSSGKSSSGKSKSGKSSSSKSNRKNKTNETEILIGICIILFVGFIVLIPTKCNNKLNNVKDLFNDISNIILLGILVFCVTLLDYKMGISMTILILIIAAYISNLDLDEIQNKYLNNSNDNELNQEPDFYQQFKMPYENFENKNVDNNSKNPTNNNLSSDELESDEELLSKMRNNKLENNSNNNNKSSNDASNNAINNASNNARNNSVNNSKKYSIEKKVLRDSKLIDNKMSKQLDYSYDFLTQVKANDHQGYDVVGCRYDLKNSFQNFTKYGPPLAWDCTYDVSKLNKCGTLFYPLNG